MRHFDEHELEGLLGLEEAIEAMRAAFAAMADGNARVQPRISAELAGTRLSMMSALLPGAGHCGAKVYTAARSRFNFVTLLFSMEDGRPIASFDAGALSSLRTAAVSCLAAQYLARPQSRTLAVFGTGTQARAHAIALAQRYPIARIDVVGRGGAPAFAGEIARRTGIPTAPATAEAALARADIVVTATRSPTPLFDGGLVREGCTIIAVGSARLDAAEIDARTLERCRRIAVESAQIAAHEAGDLALAEKAGVDTRPKWVELGELAAGRAPGRGPDDEINLFESVGSALEDVAIASLAYTRLAPGSGT